MAEPQQPSDDQAAAPQIFISQDQLGGAWANFAQVSHSPFEFTLDFVRLDYGQKPPSGVVVARVNMSPLFVSQLIEALTHNWQTYAQRALPQEVYQDDEDHDQG